MTNQEEVVAPQTCKRVEETVPAEPAPKGALVRSPKRLRQWIRWSSLTRNVLASIKDLGIIGVFVALLFFNEEVLDYLEDRGSAFLPTPPPAIDVQAALARLDRGADSLPVTEAATLGDSGPLVKGKIRKAARAEQRLLRADELDYINDWALVVSATSDLESARSAAAAATASGGAKVLVYRKNTIRLVVPLGRAEEARLAIPKVRAHYPGSVLVSLSSWCPKPAQADGMVECR